MLLMGYMCFVSDGRSSYYRNIQGLRIEGARSHDNTYHTYRSTVLIPAVFRLIGVDFSGYVWGSFFQP